MKNSIVGPLTYTCKRKSSAREISYLSFFIRTLYGFTDGVYAGYYLGGAGGWKGGGRKK